MGMMGGIRAKAMKSGLREKAKTRILRRNRAKMPMVTRNHRQSHRWLFQYEALLGKEFYAANTGA